MENGLFPTGIKYSDMLKYTCGHSYTYPISPLKLINSEKCKIWFKMRGLDSDLFRKYKNIPKDKSCNRGVFGGLYNDTNKITHR